MVLQEILVPIFYYSALQEALKVQDKAKLYSNVKHFYYLIPFRLIILLQRILDKIKYF